jgi:hypothetical protein
MSRHHVQNTPWGIIDFDEQTGAVLVQQRWLYQWRLWPGVTATWGYKEKLQFHSTVDKQIWGAWSNKIKLSITGTAAAAKRLAGRPVTMNFDVKWTPGSPTHWKVTAWKMPKGSKPTSPHRSFVDTITKSIELNTADLAPRGAGNTAGAVNHQFRTAPHEYGHAILSGSLTANPDEYVNTSGHISDSSSIMNIGRDLRKRHLAAVIAELNKLIPNLTFSVATPTL